MEVLPNIAEIDRAQAMIRIYFTQPTSKHLMDLEAMDKRKQQLLSHLKILKKKHKELIGDELE